MANHDPVAEERRDDIPPNQPGGRQVGGASCTAGCLALVGLAILAFIVIALIWTEWLPG